LIGAAMTEGHVNDAGPGQGLLLQPTGRLDADTCAELRQQLGAAFAAGVTSVVVDLTAVTRVDLTGLGVLAGAARHLRKGGGGLVVSHASPAVATAMRINGMGDLLEIAPAPALRVVPGTGQQQSRGPARPLAVVRPDALKLLS
jgi:anti-sigma B factor antagonist